MTSPEMPRRVRKSAARSAIRRLSNGSVYQRDDNGKWVAALVLTGGRRVYRLAPSEHTARLALAALKNENGYPRSQIRGKPLRESRRPMAREWTAQVLAIARDEGWTDDHTAAVIVATLAAKRIRFEIFGPCVYCGTWIANSVDHVIPRAHGGSDDPDNLVSACYECNHRKHARTPDEWRAA